MIDGDVAALERSGSSWQRRRPRRRAGAGRAGARGTARRRLAVVAEQRRSSARSSVARGHPPRCDRGRDPEHRPDEVEQQVVRQGAPVGDAAALDPAWLAASAPVRADGAARAPPAAGDLADAGLAEDDRHAAAAGRGRLPSRSVERVELLVAADQRARTARPTRGRAGGPAAPRRPDHAVKRAPARTCP